MAEVVGTAYVRIRAVTTRLAADIADGIDRGVKDAKPDIEASGAASGDAFGKKFVDEVKDKVGDQSKEVGDKFGDQLGEAMLANIRKSLGQIAKPDFIDKDAKAAGDSFGTTMGFWARYRIQKSMAALGGDNRSALSTFGSMAAETFHKSFRKKFRDDGQRTSAQIKNVFSKLFQGLQKFQLPLPFWLPMFGVGIIAGAAKLISFYIGGLIGYIGTLFEIASAGGAVVGVAFLQAVAGFGILFAALKTQTPELEAFKNEIKGTNDQWKNLAVVTQKTLIPGIKRAYETITNGLLPSLTAVGPLLGEIGGNAATAIAEMLSTERAAKMWQEFALSTAATTRNVGRLGAGLARILVPLLEKANPLAVRFTDSIASMADRWGELLERASDSGALTKFLTEGYARTEQFFKATGDLFAALWNLMQIGNQELGGSAFDTFASFSERFRAFTKSLEGQNKIRTFFQEAKPVMEEVNGLIADIFRSFGRSVSGGGTGSDNIVSFLQTLRNDILPALEIALINMSRAMDQANFEEFMVVITDLITTIFEVQMLTPILQTFTLLLQSLVAVLNVPIAGDLVKWLFILGTVSGFAAKFLGPVVKLLGFVVKGLVALGKTKAGVMLLGKLAAGAKLLWVALAPVGAAIGAAAAPILVVVGIIAAVIAAIAGLYFAFDGVRNVVDSLWQSVQEVWTLFKEVFTDFSWGKVGELLMAGIELFVRFWTALPRIAWEALWGLGELIVKFFRNLPGWIGTALSFLGEKLGQLGSFLWEWIQNAVPIALGWLGNLAATVLEWVISLPGKIWGFIQLAIPKLFEWIRNAIPQVLYWLGYALGFIVAWGIRLPIELGILLAKGAIALWSWVSDAFPQILSWLGTVLSAVWGWVSGFVMELPGRIWGAAVAIWNWIVQAIPQVLAFLGNLASSVWGWVVNFVAELPGRIAGAIGAISNWVGRAASELPGRLAEFAGRLRDWAVNLPGQLVGWLVDINSKMIDVGRAVVEGIWNGIEDMGQWIKDRIGDFAGGIIDGFKGALGIGSPAKMMVPIGVHVAEGIGVGLDKQMPVLNRQVNRHVNDLYASSVSGINSGSPSGGSATLAEAVRFLADSSATEVKVFIGDEELRDIINTQVTTNTRRQATLLLSKGI